MQVWGCVGRVGLALSALSQGAQKVLQLTRTCRGWAAACRALRLEKGWSKYTYQLYYQLIHPKYPKPPKPYTLNPKPLNP